MSKSFHRLSRDLLHALQLISHGRKKSFSAIYQGGENPTLLSNCTKNLAALRREVHVFREKDKDVKNITVRILLALALLVGFGTPVLADGWPAPTCRPPLVCMAR
jgi:hypothetical protein